MENLEDTSFFAPPQNSVPPPVLPIQQSNAPLQHQRQTESQSNFNIDPSLAIASAPAQANDSNHISEETGPPADSGKPKSTSTVPPVLRGATKKEKFFFIAADQDAGTRDERLNRVIQAKYEAGLLKPYNYVKGYSRLSRWMDRKCVLKFNSTASRWSANRDA